MQTNSITPPMDPRDPPCLEIRDYPDPPLHLVPRSAPRLADAVEAASVHRARTAQQTEREQAIADNLPDAIDQLRTAQLLDSAFALKVADVLPADMPRTERLRAGAVAVRLNDGHWQAISRYRAAQAALLVLRNLLSAEGVRTIPESELRKAADQIAGATQIARVRTWDNSDPVGPREWAKASLGILEITEDR